MYVHKKQGKVVQAWELGAGSTMQADLEEQGSIVDLGDGAYEIFTQENRSGSGEIAEAGDFFKVDNAGYPYPNERSWFLDNHESLGGDDYEQIPQDLFAWSANEEGTSLPDPVQELLDRGMLEIDWDSTEQRYGAELWGAWNTADCDAVIVFYDVEALDFNFVAYDEFVATYDIVG